MGYIAAENKARADAELAPWEWTPDIVSERIAEALETQSWLPSPRPRGYQSTMPEPTRDTNDAWLQSWRDGDPEGHYLNETPRMSAGNIGRERIARMDEAFDWFALLPHKDREAMRIVICGKALRRSVSHIRKALKSRGIMNPTTRQAPSRRTIGRWHAEGLETICRKLNCGR